MGELRGYLESRGLAVSCCVDPELALEQISRAHPDLVLIQSVRGSYDGMRFCAALRERSDVPVIVIADRGEDADCVLALEVGADDFVADQSSPRELLARIRAHVRRARGCIGPGLRVVQVGALRLEPRAMTATLDGRVLSLTSYEFQLLQVLAERAGQVLTREQLLQRVGGRCDEPFDRAIDVRISRLRGKLGDDPRAPRLLKTVRGAGYLFAACDLDPSS
ncbi:MAG: response regulator transcription factor [Deltaproteobacteria bacterium]|nr:response regulator transcription factor [Deltaproteobacteria bacterium]